MNRFVNVLLVCLMVLGAAAVYDMKYEAELASSRVAALERKVVAEQERISMLKASWSVLTQPSRLQQLTDRHGPELGLAPLNVDQLASLAEIPEKPAVMGPPAPDEIVTGSTRKRKD